MALGERHLAAEFGGDLVDHHTYVICGDGDLQEGISQEAIALAGHLKLSRMIVLYDDNHISIDGPTSLSDSSTRSPASSRPAGPPSGSTATTRTRSCRRSNGEEVRQAEPDRLPDHHRLRFAEPRRHRQGAWRAAGPLTKPGGQANLGWTAAPSKFPPTSQRLARRRQPRRETRKAWEGQLAGAGDRKAEFERRLAGKLKPDVERRGRTEGEIRDGQAVHRDPQVERGDHRRHRRTCARIAARLGRSHALQQCEGQVSRADLARRPMAAAMSITASASTAWRRPMNGLTLHGGIIAGGSTFLVFTDYCRPRSAWRR